MISLWSVESLICSITFFILTYYGYALWKLNFWRRRGIPGPEPMAIYGNFKKFKFGKTTLGVLLKEYYDEYEGEPMVGLFNGHRPVLLLRDPEIIKAVMVKDFSNFPDRGVLSFENVDPLDASLFHLEPKRWRTVRKNLTPVFTATRLKQMCTLMVECADHLEDELSKLVEENEIVDCYDIAKNYTADVIGSCGFGIEMNTLANNNSEFKRMGSKAFATNLRKILLFRFKEHFGWLYRLVGSFFFDSEESDFFINFVSQALRERKESGRVRHDFIDHLLAVRETNEHQEEKFDCSDKFLAAQAFFFFVAGFETTAVAVSGCLYELALHQDVQDKLREEINETITKNNGVLSYDVVTEMKYLNKVFQETIRKYPPIPVLFRQPVADYTFVSNKLTINAGQRVLVPTYALNYDANIYPDPEVFDPERFEDDLVAKRHKMHFIPFGAGPRNCLGMRFAGYEAKIGLISMLRGHKFDVCGKTDIPFPINHKSIILKPVSGICLKVTELQNKCKIQ